MIHVGVRDEEKVLRDGALGAPADVEREVEGGQEDASL